MPVLKKPLYLLVTNGVCYIFKAIDCGTRYNRLKCYIFKAIDCGTRYNRFQSVSISANSSNLRDESGNPFIAASGSFMK